MSFSPDLNVKDPKFQKDSYRDRVHFKGKILGFVLFH